MIEVQKMETPIGELRLASRDGTLVAAFFDDDWERIERRVERRFPREALSPASGGNAARDALRAYFDGELDALDSLEVDPGGTAFQAAVWGGLRKLAPARTASYGELAESIGSPAAVRAVGTAAGANPIGIVIPCHRLIRGDGGLGGYAGGVDRKLWLLEHERKNA